MNLLTQDYPEILLAEHEPPCVSLYLPTHRSHPDADKRNAKRFFRAVDQAVLQHYTKPSRLM